MPKHEDLPTDDEFSDEEPIPVKRDPRIFQRKEPKDDKEEDFEEDVFV